MKRTVPLLVAIFAAGGLCGWLASGMRGPFAEAQQPEKPTPVVRAAEPEVKPADGKAAEPAVEDEHPLDTLDWLVGDWVDDDEKMSVEFSCHFTKNRAFILRSFRVMEGEAVKHSGMQVIGWDESLNTIRSWTYDSEGGFGEEIWSQTGTRYTIRSKYTLPDGSKGSALATFTYLDDNRCLWKSVNREIDGELQPDIDEFALVRKPAVEEPAVEEIKKDEPKKEEPKKDDAKPEQPKKEGQ